MWEKAELLSTSYNSFYVRPAKVWNTFSIDIRDATKSVPSFLKTLLRKHYKDLTNSIFIPADPRTLKSV